MTGVLLLVYLTVQPRTHGKKNFEQNKHKGWNLLSNSNDLNFVLNILCEFKVRGARISGVEPNKFHHYQTMMGKW
ncbi:hypothetical protein ABFS82_03G026800 [Erythranthe guttata]